MARRRFEKSCCSSTHILLKIDKPISFALFSKYPLNEKYKKYNTVYIELPILTCYGSVGSSTLRLTCKKNANCDAEIDKFVEELRRL